MAERPGPRLASRPLHLFFLADCSGSMAADGKMAALNTAIREALPHLVDVAVGNPHADLLVRCIAFSTGARWHIGDPTPVDRLEWEDLRSGGYTDLAPALELLRGALTVPPLEPRALPPAILLISDGMPTDDYEPALGRLLAQPWGERSVRLAVGIGRDADHETLHRFIGDDDREPATANNPEQLVEAIRWASTALSRVASSPLSDDPSRARGLAPRLAAGADEVVW